MIIIVNSKTRPEKVSDLVDWIERKDLKTHITESDYQNTVSVIDDTSRIDENQVKNFDTVEVVKRISESFEQANRRFHLHGTVAEVTPRVRIGHGNFGLIAGSYSVESEEQIIFAVQNAKVAGATTPRDGTLRPHIFPYDSQDLKAEGLRLLSGTKKAMGLPIVTKIMSAEHIPFSENVDVIQVGAWNMQNFELLKELGKLNKPILLKRGFANMIKEFLMNAKYIMSSGNENVILYEHGIRIHEMATRNASDLSAVSVLHELPYLPVVADPSRATGVARYVRSIAMTTAASGADDLIIEMYSGPSHALSGGAQSLCPGQFAGVSHVVSLIWKATIEVNA